MSSRRILKSHFWLGRWLQQGRMAARVGATQGVSEYAGRRMRDRRDGETRAASLWKAGWGLMRAARRQCYYSELPVGFQRGAGASWQALACFQRMVSAKTHLEPSVDPPASVPTDATANNSDAPKFTAPCSLRSLTKYEVTDVLLIDGLNEVAEVIQAATIKASQKTGDVVPAQPYLPRQVAC